MKLLGKVFLILLIAALLLAGVFLAGRYGWKLLGFRACGEAAIESVEVGKGTVTIKGFYPGSFPEGFCGYYAEERSGKLYVGFRFSSVFGLFEPDSFDVVIPVKGKIDEVIVKTEATERSVWTAQNSSDAASDGYGVYVKLERSDVKNVYIRYGDVTDGFNNADGSFMPTGEWIFTGSGLADASAADNCAIPFTVSALGEDGGILAEGTFFYDAALEKLYVTVGAAGVTCSGSDAPDALPDVQPVLTLPILDEIDQEVTPGVSGSSLRAVQAAVKLLEWGVNTGLDPAEIGEAASTWLAAKGDDQSLCADKLALVDSAYQDLLTDRARDLLDVAGCGDTEIFWGSQPVESIEAIMQAAGLR